MERETVNDPEDLLPEYCHYADEGCALADSCLHCPYPECIHDLPRGRQQGLLQVRDREIARQHLAGGKTADLARKFGLSPHTVTIIIRKIRIEGATHGS